MDTLAPTKEWLNKFQHQAPALNQKVARRAYRKISQVETLLNRGDIADDQFRAAQKLHRHLLGAMGVKVQQGDESPLNDVTEYPITYHNQKVAEANKAVGNPRTWDALLAVVEETKTIAEIGQRHGVKCHKINRGVGLGIVISGLDTLVQLWGLSTRTKPPP